MNQAASIDSAIARQSELDKMLTPLLQKVDQQANEILQNQATSERQNKINPIKPIVPLHVASFAPKPLLETPQDVEAYLEAQRSALLEKIQQNHRIRLE